MSNPLNTLAFAKKQCCNQDCKQGRECPIRAARQATANAQADKDDDSSSLYQSEKKYVLSSVRLALLVYAVFALVTFVYYRVTPQ